MILADTCIWADHIGKGDPILAELLARRQIVIHPFVIGEIALGSLRNRTSLLADPRDMRRVSVATDEEVFGFIERHQLAASGIGYVDAHLLASIRIAPGTSLWIRDKRLASVAESLGVAARPVN